MFEQCEVGSRFDVPSEGDLCPAICRAPASQCPDYDKHESRELTATAETYDDALEQLRNQVPEGWVLLGIDRYLEQLDR